MSFQDSVTGTTYAWLNGQIMETHRATVGVDDGGWLHGAGLFETILVENGRAFRFEDHIERLRTSARLMLRPIERDQLPSADNLADLLQACALRRARVRLTVTAGAMQPGGDQQSNLNVCMTASPLTGYSRVLYDQGAKVLVSRMKVCPSDPLAGHKTTSYLPRLLALRDAHAAQCLEALWLTTEHHLAEGSVSNIFLISNDGRILTPHRKTPVLPGVMRATVMENAPRLGLSCEESELTINDLLDAREVFLTNVVMQVMPVVGIERHTVGDGRPGETTRRLMQEVTAAIARECE